MGTVDAILDSEGETVSQRDASSMIRNSQNDLEPVSIRNGQLSDPQSSGKQLVSPNSLRSEPDSSAGANLAQGRSERTRINSLQCSRCCKFRRSCQGEPGESCKLCTQDKIRCSFLHPRLFCCKWCKRDYSTESSLKGHITRTHSRQIQRAPTLGGPEEIATTNSPQSSVRQIATSPGQHQERSETSKNLVSNFPCSETSKPSEQAEPQRRRWPDGIHPLSQVPWFPRHSALQDSQPEETRPTHPEPSTEQDQQGSVYQNQDQSLPWGVTPAPKPYHELNFEIFDTYERRNLTPGYIQGALDGIRDDIEQYSEFTRGKDKDTIDEVRDRLRFLDEVRPLIHLQEIAAETSEMYGVQDSRLVIILRSMFTVKDNTRLEESLEILGPEVRLLTLPNLLCGVLAYYMLQFFDEKDIIREAELKATELTHGHTMAANTIQHSRLKAQECYFFQARLENRAKKLAPSLYDLIRPLTHWQQGSVHNGSLEQHLERLRKIIFASLCLAAELDVRKGIFSFFWPGCGEQFNSTFHTDEAEESTPQRSRYKEQNREKLIAFTLMPGVVRMMDDKKLVYAKALAIVTQPNEQDGI